LVAILLSACGGATPASRVYAWIDVPTDGLTFPDIQAIKIVGHATAPDGVASAEIWINSILVSTIPNPPMEGPLANFHLEWTPPALGEYTIMVVAYGMDGTGSKSDSATVNFGEITATPVPDITDTPTPVNTVTTTPSQTPTSPAGIVARFWADTNQVAAGSCTTLRWHAENVKKVIFAEAEQPFDGSYQVCPCENRQYTLTVVHLDDTRQNLAVDISVTGSCVTPSATRTRTPVPDTTPPPAPTPQVPANPSTLNCRAAQNLVWLPVSDPSGIAEYQVQVQRHSGDNNWQDVSGSIFTGITDKQFSVTVECGWYYRWRVRAVDGAGNIGPWSVWSLFTIILT
jgi:hypothetical protein